MSAAGMGLYCFADGSRVQGQWSDGWPLDSNHLEPGQDPDAQYTKNIPSPLDKPAKKGSAGGPSVPAKKPVKKVSGPSSNTEYRRVDVF